MSAAYPGASLYLPMAQSVAMGPMGSSVPVAFYPVGPVYHPGSTVLVDGGFDAGARFATGAPANIPVSCPCNVACLFFSLSKLGKSTPFHFTGGGGE